MLSSILMNWFAATAATNNREALTPLRLVSHPSHPVWLLTHKAVNASTTLQITVVTRPTSMVATFAV